MEFLVEKLGLLPASMASATFVFLRYALLAGAAYLLFYVWRRSRWQGRKIQGAYPSWAKMRSEIGHSLTSAAVFAVVAVGIYFLRQVGWALIYTDITTWGYGYLLASLVLLIVLHDTYFYWIHRLMHHPRLYRILHLTHHESHNPTPWASLAFHPLEALIEISILPVLVCLIPLHPAVILAFATWSLAWNIVGHLGFEIFPAGWVDHPLWRYLNTSTHHNIHHRKARGNYSLYFNWWDRWCGTMHPDYEPLYRQLTNPTSPTSAQ